MRHFRFILAGAAAIGAVPAAAQDAIMALNPTTMIGYAGVSAANQYARDSYGGRARRDAAPVRIGPAFATPARGPAVAVAYPAPTAQFRRQAVAEYIARARQHDARSADFMAAQFAQHDYGPIYDRIMQPYGLNGNDAAKSLAAYLLLGWTIVHNNQEPPAAGIRGVRAQAAQALADPRLSGPGTRAKLGEEFKILFVTIHAGWQAAQREGTLDRYSAGVAQLLQQTDGIDLRRMRVGSQGFAPQ